MKLSDLLTDIQFKGNFNDCEIHAITHDSRKVKNGSLFVAIHGLITDGHDFIPEAVQNGAAAILSNGRHIDEIGIPIIRVSDPRETLSQLSANLYGHPSKHMTVVGVTGTNGKTSVTLIIDELLKTSGVLSGTLGTLGFTTPTGMVTTGFTTPEATEIQQLFRTLSDGGVNNLVMEVSSHALELKRVRNVEFDFAVFTNLTEDHLDFHGNLENYFESKLKLFKNLTDDKTAIINVDDPWAKKIIPEITCNSMTYGFSSSADLYPEFFDFSLDGIKAELICGNSKIIINSALIGEYNLYNIMAAVATALKMSIPTENIEIAISKMDTIPGRMERFSIENKGSVIVDYAHTPDAYNQIFSTLKKVSTRNIKIITIFGCGGNREKEKRPKMAGIAEKFSDEIIVTTDNPRDELLTEIMDDIQSGFTCDNYSIIENRFDAIQEGISRMDGKSLLLLLGKGREDHQLINGVKYPHSDIEIVKSFMV